MQSIHWLPKSLFTLFLLSALSACATTPSDSTDSTTSAVENTSEGTTKVEAKPKTEVEKNIDQSLEAVFSPESGLF